MKKISINGMFCLVIIGLLSGCANNKIANTDILSQQAKEQASSSNLSPQEAILKAANLIEQSQNDQLHFYAPLHYNASKEALTEAQDLLSNKTEDALVLEQTFKVDSLIKSAYNNKKKVLSTLNKSLKHKQTLEELGSPETLPEDYQETVDDLKDLIKEIEGGFMDKALQGQATLLTLMTEVEIATLKKQHLSPAESMIDKAESIDADEYAEKTFAQAEQTLESVRLFIEKNYKDRKAVKSNGLDALNAASHAYFIAQEATELVELNRADAENKALYFESLLERINKSVGIEDLNTMSLYDQSVLIAEKVEKMKYDNANLSNTNNDKLAITTENNSSTVDNETPENATVSAALNDNIILETQPILDIQPVSEDTSNIDNNSAELEDASQTEDVPQTTQN